MIDIEETQVFGWEATIRGMRNPMNSWKKTDTVFVLVDDSEEKYLNIYQPKLGDNDLKLMKALIKGGGDERKFLRMLHVQMDITAPLYWWKEFDTYKIGTVANSCSTMHKITSKEFSMEDFSTEHLFYPSYEVLGSTIRRLNDCRDEYLFYKAHGDKDRIKEYWWQLIQLLPSSYNQKRTIDLNYEVLLRIYPKRKNHKLDEWHTFCDWIESLPYMKDFLEAAYEKELHN